MSTRLLSQRHLLFCKYVVSTARKRFIMTSPVRALKIEKIDNSLLLEEETVKGYKAEDYYPVRIGQVFQERYQTIGKLGYGSASTVWLCRDLQQSKYAALKIYINRSKIHRELAIYERINSLHSEHEGRHHVRKLYDSFQIHGPHGTHICLVHQPMGMTLDDIVSVRPGRVLSAGLVRELFRFVIRGLQYLHEEARVIHTDLQPNNILMGVMDDQVFKTFEYYEMQNPCPRKELGDRTIYMSRPMPFSAGAPSLSDLSEARFGEDENSGDIMPDRYRAPEVILGLPWSYPVDTWSLGMVIWDLFQGTPLFPARNPEGQYSERYHLAQMVAVMGPPPLDFVQRLDKSNRFWNSDGKWKNEIPIPERSLESAEHQLEGEEKELFLTFMRKMLQWKPEDRCNCHDIFFDEWLLADLIAEGVVTVDDE